MTTPNPISDQISVGAKELVDRAQDLGVSWGLRQATVSTGGVGTGVKVILDGDSIAIPVNSTLANVNVGERVFIMSTPPGANILIGQVNNPGNLYVPTTGSISIDGISGPRGVRFYLASQSDTSAIGTGFTSIMSGSFTKTTGRTYRISLGGRATLSTTTNVIEFAVHWIPSGGVEASIWDVGAFGPSGATPPVATNASGVIVNNGATKSGTLLVYIRSQNAGTATWNGAATIPRFLMLEDIGDNTAFANATGWPGA